MRQPKKKRDKLYPNTSSCHLFVTWHFTTFSNEEKLDACSCLFLTNIDVYKTDVTMLLGAAAMLKKVEKAITGTVRLVFQPAEEGGAGMKRMVEEGVVGGSNNAGLMELEAKVKYILFL